MSGYNYGNDYGRQGDYQRPQEDNSPGGAGLAGDYYNNAPGGYQQHQGSQYGQNPQGSQYGQNPQGSQYGQNPQGYPPRGDDRWDDRRDDHREDHRDRRDDNDGPDGERGVMGALAGAAAGGFGGAKLGGKATGHSKTSAVVGALAGAFAGHKLQDAASDWKDDRDEKKEEEKRRKDEEKRRDDDYDRPHRRRNSRSRSRSSSRSSRSSHRRRRDSRSRGGGRYAGHFTASSRDIDLDDRGDYNLRASCERYDGSYQSSTISLNHILENDNGSFRWSSGGGHSRPNTVTVQQGDTLRSIAANFGCSFEEIARHNGINNPDLIYPGQVLQVPGGGGSRSGGGGNFGSSARHVRLVDGGSKLEAELRRENGEWVRSSIVLDERIKNDNGTLRLI